LWPHPFRDLLPAAATFLPNLATRRSRGVVGRGVMCVPFHIGVRGFVLTVRLVSSMCDQARGTRHGLRYPRRPPLLPFSCPGTGLINAGDWTSGSQGGREDGGIGVKLGKEKL